VNCNEANSDNRSLFSFSNFEGLRAAFGPSAQNALDAGLGVRRTRRRAHSLNEQTEMSGSTTAVDYHDMQLYRKLRKAGVDEFLACAVCRIAIKQKIRHFAGWVSLSRCTLMDWGLNAAESAIVWRALHGFRLDEVTPETADLPVGLPTGLRPIGRIAQYNAEIDLGLRVGPALK